MKYNVSSLPPATGGGSRGGGEKGDDKKSIFVPSYKCYAMHHLKP